MNEKFNIVVVDDHMRYTAAFIQRIKKLFSEAEVSLFDNVTKAVEFILSTLETRTIVFLDCKIDVGEQGIDGLKQIREKTSLVSVVMMSANPLVQMEESDLLSMINADNLYFIKNSDMRTAEEIIKKTQIRWKSQVDCVLEQWVLNRSKQQREMPYIMTPKGTMSLNDILSEIRNKTELGINMEKNIIQVAIDSMTRKKENND